MRDLGLLPRVRRGARRGRRPCRWTSTRVAGTKPAATGRATSSSDRSSAPAGRSSRRPAEAHAALPNVTIETGVNVVGLICDGGRVRGVQLTQDDVQQSLDADFVVDCSGRGSSAAHWLQDIGYPAPEVVEVHCNVRYATLTLRRHADDLDATFAVILESPPHGKRAAFVMPIEGDRWITTIASSFGCGSSERLRRVPRRRRDAAIIRAARPVVSRRTDHRCREPSPPVEPPQALREGQARSRPGSSHSATRSAASTRCTDRA